MRHPRLLDRERAALVVIDLQASYRPILHDWEGVEEASLLLVRGATLLGIPILVTEQYPRGLGHTSERVRLVLGSNVPVIEKSSMSCCGADLFVETLGSLGRSQVLIAGIETHACVNQTALDLITLGYMVNVARDATSSRHEELVRPAWDGMLQAGIRPTSAEQALLELVRNAKSPEFKELQSLLKARRL
jgi:nicotinamidase-related amidase